MSRASLPQNRPKTAPRFQTSAILLAAGEGRRLGGKIPKGWFPFRGEPLAIHAVEKFSRIPAIREIIVVAHPQFLDLLSARLHAAPPKIPVRIVAGGKTRQESVRKGMDAAAPGSRYILTHDVARPVVHRTMVEAAIRKARRYGAAVVAARATDTLAMAHGPFLRRSLDRNRIAVLQTPQVFRAEILRLAHRQAEQDRFKGTDETSLVRRTGRRVAVVWNPYPNPKITFRTDLRLIETLLRSTPSPDLRPPSPAGGRGKGEGSRATAERHE